MRNLALLLFASCLLFISSCKKDSSPSPNNPANPYYFSFTLNGTNYNLNANFPQYMSFYTNVVGGYQDANGALFPSIGLSLNWPVGDTAKESDVMGLIGRTLDFSNSASYPQPQITFDEANTSIPTWYSNDTSNVGFNVKITNVVFLKKDTTLGNPLRTYVITGTCSAVISQSDSTSVLSAGKFNFVISRRDL